MRALLVVACFGCATALSISPATPAGVVSAHLRGTSELDSFGNQSAGPGQRGHFYYADGCEDCVFKGDQCGCQPVVEYFACLTKHCHKASDAAFSDKCSVLSNKCATALDIDCKAEKTVCKSKFHQLPTGGLGLSVKVNKDKAFCGPYGKCIGKVVMNVDVFNRPKPPMPVVSVPASPAPAVPAAPGAAPSPAAVAPPAVAPPPPAAPIWLECGLPIGDKANFQKKEDWKICQVEVKADTASCGVPLFKELEIGETKKSYCVITDGMNGKRLTQPYWSAIMNVHKVVNTRNEKAKTAEEDLKEQEEQEAKKEEDMKKGRTEEEKAEAHIKKEVDEAEANIKKDVDEVTGQPPWMADKAERAAKQAEAKQAKGEEKEEKVTKTKAEKKVEYGKNDSELPWMDGKKDSKPAAPTPVKAID